uniref:Carbohydrate sulfotransferase n=1 Tax=Oryzias latipes TaxID=8090 RepID=A0A3B3H5V8_ORYLA
MVKKKLCLFSNRLFPFWNKAIGWRVSPKYLEQQRLRKDLLRKHCAGVNQSLFNLNNIDLNNFIVDDQHGIIYCYIPKVACTNWKRTLIALKQNEPYPDPMSFKSNMVHKFDRFRLLKHYSMPERKAKLKHYTKFLFVRDPFVRLISAYRDKMLNYDHSAGCRGYSRSWHHRELWEIIPFACFGQNRVEHGLFLFAYGSFHLAVILFYL